MNEFGELLGWLTIITYVGTMLNYVLKYINKRISKKLGTITNGKKIMSLLMKIFVKNHRYWGFFAVLFVLFHFFFQFSSFGINITGVIAAIVLVSQIGVGMYGAFLHKKRSGAWFWLHRTIAVFLIISIAMHLLLP